MLIHGSPLAGIIEGARKVSTAERTASSGAGRGFSRLIASDAAGDEGENGRAARGNARPAAVAEGESARAEPRDLHAGPAGEGRHPLGLDHEIFRIESPDMPRAVNPSARIADVPETALLTDGQPQQGRAKPPATEPAHGWHDRDEMGPPWLAGLDGTLEAPDDGAALQRVKRHAPDDTTMHGDHILIEDDAPDVMEAEIHPPSLPATTAPTGAARADRSEAQHSPADHAHLQPTSHRPRNPDPERVVRPSADPADMLVQARFDMPTLKSATPHPGAPVIADIAGPDRMPGRPGGLIASGLRNGAGLRPASDAAAPRAETAAIPALPDSMPMAMQVPVAPGGPPFPVELGQKADQANHAPNRAVSPVGAAPEAPPAAAGAISSAPSPAFSTTHGSAPSTSAASAIALAEEGIRRSTPISSAPGPVEPSAQSAQVPSMAGTPTVQPTLLPGLAQAGRMVGVMSPASAGVQIVPPGIGAEAPALPADGSGQSKPVPFTGWDASSLSGTMAGAKAAMPGTFAEAARAAAPPPPQQPFAQTMQEPPPLSVALAAASTMVEAAAATHTAPAAETVHMARRVAEQIAVSVQRGSAGLVTLQLSPAELGRVDIAMQPREHGMTLLVTAERPETLELLRRHADLLSDDLRALGYTELAFRFGDGGERHGAWGENRNGAGSGSPADTGSIVNGQPGEGGSRTPTAAATPVRQPGRLDLRY